MRCLSLRRGKCLGGKGTGLAAPRVATHSIAENKQQIDESEGVLVLLATGPTMCHSCPVEVEFESMVPALCFPRHDVNVPDVGTDHARASLPIYHSPTPRRTENTAGRQYALAFTSFSPLALIEPRYSIRNMSGGDIKSPVPLILEIASGIGIRVVTIEQHSIGVGRGPNNTIIIADPQVSRSHATLDRIRGSGWRIQDLGSRNGTFINGIPVGGRPVAFGFGDEVRVGDTSIRVREGDLDDADAATVQGAAKAATEVLSRRERAVLQLVAIGSTDAQIAEQLTISIHTVHSHLDSIRAKTGARRRPEMVRLALQHSDLEEA